MNIDTTIDTIIDTTIDINIDTIDTKTHDPSYKNVIGITSLWLLYPLIIYLFDFLQTRKFNLRNNILYIFVWLWIFVCCIISYVMWEVYDKDSLLYKLDIVFAQGTFVLLLYITFIANTYDNIYTKLKKSLLPIGVGVFYLLTCKLYENGFFSYAAFSHLMFRFIGFWWTYIALNKYVSQKRFIILSCMYWLYIIYYKYVICKNDLVNCYDIDEYRKGTYELLLLIAFCILMF